MGGLFGAYVFFGVVVHHANHLVGDTAVIHNFADNLCGSGTGADKEEALFSLLVVILV